MHLVGEHHTPTRHTMRGLGTFMSIPNARSQDNARAATAIWSVAVLCSQCQPFVRDAIVQQSGKAAVVCTDGQFVFLPQLTALRRGKGIV